MTGRTRAAGRPRFWLVAMLLAGVVVVAAIVPLFLTVPTGNYAGPSFDAILVLGSPTAIDGSLTAAQRWRVDEAVREFRAGRAPYMIITGGRTTRKFVEADTMAAYALQQGVAPSSLLEEREALTTWQNLRNSQRLLQARGWRRVEVISTAEHLRRAALLLQHTGLRWRTHAAPTPGRSRWNLATGYAGEAAATALIRIFGLRVVPLIHAVAVTVRGIGFAVHWIFSEAVALGRRRL